MRTVLFIVVTMLAFWLTRPNNHTARAVIWLIVGASLGPYLVDSPSVTAYIRNLLWPPQTDDRIEVPSTGPTLFGADALEVEYPAGVRIVGTRPVWGSTVHGLSMYYPITTGFTVTCSTVHHDWDRAYMDFYSQRSHAEALRVAFNGMHRDFPASIRTTDNPDVMGARRVSVSGEQTRMLARYLSELPFPGEAVVSVLDGTKEETIARLYSTGTVLPKSDDRHARFVQPPSNPFRVMARFCNEPGPE